MWTISVPISVVLPRKRKKDVNFYLNLNAYRNADFFTLNAAKIRYKEIVTPLFSHIPKMARCSMEFKLFVGSNHLSDVSNICAIVEKFFNDAFVEAGKISDDNYTVVFESRYNFGGVDKNNPRVEITIEPFEQEEAMQLTLPQSDIESAIDAYVREMITVREGHEIQIELKATRGDQGNTAIINIVPAGTPREVPEKPSKAAAETVARPRLGVAAAVAEAQKNKQTEVVVQRDPATDTVTDQNQPSAEVQAEVAADPVVESQPVQEQPVEQPVVKKSLFGNLTKPA